MKIYKTAYFIDGAYAYFIDGDNNIIYCEGNTHITSIINHYDLEPEIKIWYQKEFNEDIDWSKDWDTIADYVHDFTEENHIFFVVVDMKNKQVYVRPNTRREKPSSSQMKALSDWAIEHHLNEEVIIDFVVAKRLNGLNWYKIAKFNHYSQMRGEYWVVDGQALFADGDVGDMNHEAYVIDHIQRKFVSNEFDGIDYVDWQEFENSILENKFENGEISQEIKDLGNMGETGNKIIIKALKELGMTDEEISIARGSHPDAREYGIKKLGWKRVTGDSVETQFLTRDDLSDLRSGLSDALESEGDESDHTFDIEVRSTNTIYSDVPYSIIEQLEPSLLLPYGHRYAKSNGLLKTAADLDDGWIDSSQNVIYCKGKGHINYIIDNPFVFGISKLDLHELLVRSQEKDVSYSSELYNFMFSKGFVRFALRYQAIAIQGYRNDVSNVIEKIHKIANSYGVSSFYITFIDGGNMKLNSIQQLYGELK